MQELCFFAGLYQQQIQQGVIFVLAQRRAQTLARQGAIQRIAGIIAEIFSRHVEGCLVLTLGPEGNLLVRGQMNRAAILQFDLPILAYMKPAGRIFWRKGHFGSSLFGLWT